MDRTRIIMNLSAISRLSEQIQFEEMHYFTHKNFEEMHQFDKNNIEEMQR